MSCLLGENRDLFFPKLDHDLNLVTFSSIAEKYLIPESLQEHKNSIQVKDEKLVIPKEDFLCAIELSSELQKTDIVNFENIFKNDSKFTFTEKQMKILRPYQIDGVLFLERLKLNGFGALLADDMGLGKTIQTIVFFCTDK